MNYGLLSLLPPVVAVILAIWSKNVISCYCFLFKEERTLFYGCHRRTVISLYFLILLYTTRVEFCHSIYISTQAFIRTVSFGV